MHTGQKVTLQFLPAPVDTGIIFQRTDLENFVIEAAVGNVAKVSYATSLMKKGVLIYTVEHVLSALRGCGVSNAIVAMDNLETPILDGSARGFIQAIDEAGIKTQRKAQRFLKIKREFQLTDGKKMISISPANEFRLIYDIDFTHPLIGRQRFELSLNPESYRTQLGIARTFGFFSEVENLRQSGLIRGGSLENAIVLTDDRMLNDCELQFKDEFVRHKMLDLIGDLTLVGYPMLACVNAHRAGHALHTALVSKILKDASLWELVEFDPQVETPPLPSECWTPVGKDHTAPPLA